MPGMSRLACLLVLVGTLVAAPPASAAVLISAIPKRLVCGDPLSPGIWSHAGTKGSRRVSIKAIDRRSGKVWWRKTATAPFKRWRYWTLPSGMDGQCKPTTIVYRLHGRDTRFNVTFRPEAS
jgi:hypothetical protein